ncbi:MULTISPECIES: hypothetical protein [unclassified Campylobacter]|uniref:hypothetical protein n=1 Tax=unclassified Campylobacter TaxID=2593542 RepID=UPI003D32D197
MLQRIEKQKETYKFSDGQEVVLYAPTLGQIRNSEKSKDDMEKLIKLLVDMSKGEMDEAFLNDLPISELSGLSEVVAKLSGTLEIKN